MKKQKSQPTVKNIYADLVPLHEPHEEKTINLKSAGVDLKMIPVVKWLNSFESIYTRWSCQGSNDPNSRPYVIFLCDNTVELVKVLPKFKWFATVELEWYEPGLCLRYMAVFDSTEALDRFIHRLGTSK